MQKNSGGRVPRTHDIIDMKGLKERGVTRCLGKMVIKIKIKNSDIVASLLREYPPKSMRDLFSGEILLEIDRNSPSSHQHSRGIFSDDISIG